MRTAPRRSTTSLHPSWAASPCKSGKSTCNRNGCGQKQQEFETISENMAEGLVLLDGRGYVLAINQSALKRLRMDGKKALGRHAYT